MDGRDAVLAVRRDLNEVVEQPVHRGPIFAAVLVVCLMVAGTYVGLAALRLHAEAAPPRPAATTNSRDPSGAFRDGPHVVFRNVGVGRAGRRIGLASLDAPGGERAIADLECDRVYFAAKLGICLTSQQTALGPSHKATLFDSNLRPVRSFSLAGVPSRARISPDGRYAATTVFVNGDSYAEYGFSTRATIFDVVGGHVVGDLEQFSVLRQGVAFRAADFNFWGVTFARDSDRFYATLATADQTYLVEGTVSGRQMRVLRDGVECPSLSPDNAHIAFKQRAPSGGWRLHVLDLATLADTPLNETRSIDDQVEWLDDGHVLYGARDIAPGSDSTNIWVLPVDGTAAPRVFVPNAFSPAVVRPD